MNDHKDYRLPESLHEPQETPSGPQRAFFQTVAGPGATPYPEDADPKPNVYYARKLKNVSFPETPGVQTLSYAYTSQSRCIFNMESTKYIEVDSIVLCFKEGTQWFTIDKVAGRPYVTTRKLRATNLSVVWDGDWGPTVRPGPLTSDAYPDDSESLIILTDIAVDSAGRVWCTAFPYIEGVAARSYQPTAKEFANANGDLTGRTFDWNEDVQGNPSFGGGRIYKMGINAFDELFFGGDAAAPDDTFGFAAGLAVDQTLDRNPPLFGAAYSEASGHINAVAADPVTDGYFFGYNIAPPTAIASYINRTGTAGWSRVLSDPGASISAILDVALPGGGGVGANSPAFLTNVASINGSQIHAFSDSGVLGGVSYLGGGRGGRALAITEGQFVVAMVRNATGSLVRKNGNVDVWTYDTGGELYDVATDADGNIYAVGDRVIDGDGNAATLWKFDPDGNLLATFDHGDTLRAVRIKTFGSDTFVYVCGDRAEN